MPVLFALAGRPVHGASAEDVEVKVVDGLTAVAASVDDDAVAVGEMLAGDGRGGVEEFAEQGCGSVGGGGKVLAGDGEEVSGGFGVDVGEDDGVLVLVDGLDGDGAVGDFAEDAVVHGGIVLRFAGGPPGGMDRGS